ncbi:MAG TPA: efflux RND transporter periplasmic adaptor subunit [Nitrospirota bacterium]|nr:efflux RND transporter periplasmic adaptor subunit [Nitrospirota bacterium]
MLEIMQKIMPRRVGIIILAAGVLTVIIVGGWLFRSKGNSEPAFQTAQVKRGDLVPTISATGTVEPEQVVDVGAQVAGIIMAFGKDKFGNTIDYGSVVEKGTVLAKIDDSLYAAALETAKAQVKQAEANKISAEANVLQMKAKLVDAQRDWDRAQKIGPSDALAQTVYDQYRATYEVAKANVAVAEAAVEQTKAAIAQAKASLTSAATNLDYCTIKSPVNGVIVDRQVTLGQTVVSSLSAPSLFLIATDLKRIQIWVSVNEADIGSISKGQTVTFTVDAFPDQIFEGHVNKVRLNAAMVQNVVTYTVEVNTPNDNGRLLPYLSANVQFKIGHLHDVLLVPNAALRWSPRPNQIVPEPQGASHPSGVSSNRESGGKPGNVGVPRMHGIKGIIWAEQGKFVRPVNVNVGLTDGTVTEVEGDGVIEGMRVVVGERKREAAKGPSEERSPFTPQNPFRPQTGGQRQGQEGPGGQGGPAGGR